MSRLTFLRLSPRASSFSLSPRATSSSLSPRALSSMKVQGSRKFSSISRDNPMLILTFSTGEFHWLCCKHLSTKNSSLDSPNRLWAFLNRISSWTTSKKDSRPNTKKFETEKTVNEKKKKKTNNGDDTAQVHALSEPQDMKWFVTDRSQNDRFIKLRKEITDYSGSFVNQYHKDVDVMIKTSALVGKMERMKTLATVLKEVSPSSPPATQVCIPGTKKKRRLGVERTKKYFLFGEGLDHPQYTQHFEQCKAFLQSMNISAKEIEFYPDVQMMDNNDILDCVQRLKEEGIHVIYNLFLIQRMFEEIKEERVTGVVPMKDKLKNGLKRLAYMRKILFYKSLCEELETPDLDPHWLMEECINLNVSANVHGVRKKIRLLKSMGASVEFIKSNLIILRTAERKAKLYERSGIKDKNKTFPHELFCAEDMKTFREHLGVRPESHKLAKLLGISLSEYLACWGHKDIFNPDQLVHKVRMCLKVGIPQKDIHANIQNINSFPLEKFYTVLTSFKDSGLPVSIYLLNEMDIIVTHQEGRNEQEKEISSSLCPSRQVMSRKGNVSMKKRRHIIFKLIMQHLRLDKSSSKAMFRCVVDVDNLHITDVIKNLDFLLNLGFDHHHLARCPLILAHPHLSLVTVVKNAHKMVTAQLNTTTATVVASSSFSSPRIFKQDHVIQQLPSLSDSQSEQHSLSDDTKGCAIVKSSSGSDSPHRPFSGTIDFDTTDGNDTTHQVTTDRFTTHCDTTDQVTTDSNNTTDCDRTDSNDTTDGDITDRVRTDRDTTDRVTTDCDTTDSSTDCIEDREIQLCLRLMNNKVSFLNSVQYLLEKEVNFSRGTISRDNSSCHLL